MPTAEQEIADVAAAFKEMRGMPSRGLKMQFLQELREVMPHVVKYFLVSTIIDGPAVLETLKGQYLHTRVEIYAAGQRIKTGKLIVEPGSRALADVSIPDEHFSDVSRGLASHGIMVTDESDDIPF